MVSGRMLLLLVVLTAFGPVALHAQPCASLSKLASPTVSIVLAETVGPSTWVRLFMAPGMAHCGGEGPDTFDTISLIEEWVEQGRAPERIIAAHRTAGKVDRPRPLCPYPQVARYRGSGSIDESSNFVCGSPH
jgi:feruloyl esterase